MARNKNTVKGLGSRFIALEEVLGVNVPSLSSYCAENEDFRELRIKAKIDGTFLVVLKGYFPDGGEAVCFASGYNLAGALLGIDSTIQSGNWKVDKPWPATEK